MSRISSFFGLNKGLDKDDKINFDYLKKIGANKIYDVYYDKLQYDVLPNMKKYDGIVKY